MGLLDILNQSQQQGGSRPQMSMGSAMTMAMMGLLAYKALKGSGQPGQPGQPSPAGAAAAGGGLGALIGSLLGGGGNLGQTLSNIIPGGLGGATGGASTGSVVSGGLANIVEELEASGHGNAVQSWIGNGPNQEISPQHLESALGPDTIDAIAKQTGMNKDELLAGLSKALPGFVDQLTPNGRLPTEQEASRMAA